MSIPKWIRRREPKLVPIGPAVWQLLNTFECLTPINPQVPLVSRMTICLALSIPRWICTWVQIWCQSVQPFDSFNILLNLWARRQQNAPWDIEGRIVFSLCPFPDESADLYQIWCQSIQPFDSFPKHLNLWPPKPPLNAPGVLWGDM